MKRGTNNKMKKLLSMITVCLLGIYLFPTIGQAEDKAMAYSVKANIPENQINKTLTYFDLKMEPNQKQEITLTVTNSSDQEETIIISPNVAITNQNGVIDYSQSGGKLDSSLKNPLTSIISNTQEVKLAPKESKEVPFILQMPEKPFDGTVLGGFYIAKKENEKDLKEADKNVQIRNQFSYVIGLQIRENINEIEPDMVLNKVQPALLNYRTAITANLQNTKATMMKDLEVVAKVTKKGETKILHEATKKSMSMAPNSNFDFPINWDNEVLKPGTYMLNLVAKSGDKEWKFDKEFTISDKESKKLNKDAVELVKEEPNWWLIIGLVAAGMIVLFALLAFFINKNARKKEAEKQARLRRQRKRKKMQEKKTAVTIQEKRKKGTSPRKKQSDK